MYIPAHRRDILANLPADKREQSAGHDPASMSYEFTRLISQWIGNHPSFADISDVVAALEITKLELYRRVGGPYQDYKRLQNGDVYQEREGGWGP